MSIEYIGGLIACIALAHLIGDYILQNDWMAQEKTRSTWIATLHGALYTLPFLLLTQSVPALVVISSTHALIDHYRLARYIVWFRNQFAPKSFRPRLTATGMSEDRPPFLSVWLLIITDNILHILINLGAILWL